MDRLRKNRESLKMKDPLESFECETCPWAQLLGMGGGREFQHCEGFGAYLLGEAKYKRRRVEEGR